VLAVLAETNAFEKSAATLLFVLIVVGIVYGGYRLFQHFGRR
jgi:hypothetical protein